MTTRSINSSHGSIARRAAALIRQWVCEGRQVRVHLVAEEVGVSQFHFSRIFKKKHGISPHAYYDKQRARRALQLQKEGRQFPEIVKNLFCRRRAVLTKLLKKYSKVRPLKMASAG